MMKYCVSINGQNFLVKMDGREVVCGFFTTRFVEAESPDAAEGLAIESVRNLEGLGEMVLNEQGNPPMLFADEIEQVENFEAAESTDQGLIWYTEEDE